VLLALELARIEVDTTLLKQLEATLPGAPFFAT
jgi:hypothetical protein